MRAHKRRPVLVDVSGVRGGGTVRLDIGQANDDGPFVIHLISYRPGSTVAIKRGENAGRTLQYSKRRHPLAHPARMERAVMP